MEGRATRLEGRALRARPGRGGGGVQSEIDRYREGGRSEGKTCGEAQEHLLITKRYQRF